MKPHITKFKSILFIFIFFIASASFAQEISSTENEIDLSSENIIETQKELIVAEKENSAIVQNNTTYTKEKVKQNNTVNQNKIPTYSKAINQLNNKLQTVILENKMLNMRSNVSISKIDLE